MRWKVKTGNRILSPLLVISMLLFLVAGALTVLLEPSPAFASPGAGLSVEVKTYSDNWGGTEAGTFCRDSNIYVTATVSNPGDATTHNVSAVIDWALLGGAATWVAGGNATPPHAISLGDIDPGTNATANWTLQCAEVGSATIRVTATGTEVSAYGDKAIDQLKAHLVVTLSALPDTLCACQNFTTTVTVENTGNVVANNVTPSLSMTGPGGATCTGPSPASADIDPANTTTFTWDCHCDRAGDVTINVTVAGDDGCTGESIPSENIDLPDNVTVTQEKAHLVVTLSASPDIVCVCQNFTTTVTVENTGNVVANNVTPSLSMTGPGEATCTGPSPASADIDPATTETFTWDCHCDKAGDVTINVTVAGDDGCSGMPIPSGNIDLPANITVAQDKAHLVVTLSASRTTVTVCQDFTTTVNITNTGNNDANVIDVSLTITPDGEVTCSYTGPTLPVIIPKGDGTETFTWDCHCDKAGDVTINVTVAGVGTGVCEDRPIPSENIELPGPITVTQQDPPVLEVEILSPDSWIWLGTCQDFAVSATVTNVGEATAIDVVAFIDPGDTASAVSPGVNIYIGTLRSGESEMVTWTLHCDEPGKTIIAVNAAGNDNNTGLPIDPVAEAWSALYDGGDEDTALAVAVDSYDNIIVTGYSHTPGPGIKDVYTIKYDSAGNVIWQKAYDSGFADSGVGVAVDSNDCIIVFGQTHFLPTTQLDYLVIKYDPYGNLLWVVHYDVLGMWGMDYANGVAVDSQDNIIVTGYSDYGVNWNYYTVKFRGTDGIRMWEKVYDSGFDDYGTGVAVDSDDNVIVTGYTDSGPNPTDYLTVKYDKDGNQLWAVTYDGGDDDEAWAVAVDLQDNIIVTGYSVSPNPDYLTIKYDKDGNQLWAVTYDGGPQDYAYGVAVDSGDNIIVTGSSYDATTNYGYLTIKYDPDGNVVAGWPVLYDSGLADEAYGVAVDSGDNVIVTGYSYNATSGSNDYYTIKYHTVPDYLIVQQYAKAHLVVDITVPYDGITYATCQTFDVIATVTNTGWADAWEVKATISISPEGSARLTEGGYTLDIGTLTGHGAWQSELPEVRAQASAEVSWTLHCKQACSTTITVTTEGKDEYGYQTQKVYVEGYYDSYYYYQSYYGYQGWVEADVAGDIEGFVYGMTGYFNGYIDGVYFVGLIDEEIYAEVEGYFNGFIVGVIWVEGSIDGDVAGYVFEWPGCDSYYGFYGDVAAYVHGDIKGFCWEMDAWFTGYIDGEWVDGYIDDDYVWQFVDGWVEGSVSGHLHVAGDIDAVDVGGYAIGYAGVGCYLEDEVYVPGHYEVELCSHPKAPIPENNIEPDSITVKQLEKPHLRVEIVAPENDDTFAVCQDFGFYVKAKVYNDGEADALFVTATLHPGATALPAETLYELGQSENGTAEWTTEKAHSGDYSVKLSIPVNYTSDDAALVALPLTGVSLNDITSLSYWYYVDPSTPATADVYEGFIKGEACAEPHGSALCGYAAYDVYGAPYLIIELDVDGDAAADTWVIQAKWAADTSDAWVQDIIDAAEPFHVAGPYAHTTGFTIGVDWGTLSEIKAATETIGATTYTLGDATVLKIKTAIGWWNPAGPTPPNDPVVSYVDDIEVSGITYDLEPISTVDLGTIPGGSWAQVIWELHCTNPGDSEITVTASGYYGVPRKVDVFLLVDVSGSMAMYMNDIEDLAPDLFDAVTAIVPDAQFGVGSFQDFPFDGWGAPTDSPYDLVLDMTDDGAAFEAAVGALVASGGGDWPQSQYEALYQAATGLGLDLNGDGDYDDPGDIAPGQNPSFRDDALKIIILVTDADFHNPGDPPSVLPECPGGYRGASRHATVDAMRAADIKVIGLESPYTHIAQLLDVVDATGGKLFVITTAPDILSGHIADDVSLQADVVDPSKIPVTNIEHDQIIIHQVTAMAHLVVDILFPEDGDMFYKGDEFLVTAMVSNTGAGNATGVNVTISWNPNLVSLVAPGLTQTIDIPAGESRIVNWTLVAGDTEGYTIITVTATGPNTAIDAVTVEIDPPPTIVLYEGVNPIVYTGETASLPAALTNISDKVKIIWQRDESTGGEWHYFYFDDGTPMGNITELVNGTAYIVVVTEDCTWEVLY